MPGSAPELLASLARVRWTVLGLLALCAAMSWLRDRETSELPSTLAAAAMPLGIGIGFAIVAARIMTQRSRSARTRFYSLLATYLLSAALGVLGVCLTLLGDDGSRGALFAIGGAVFTLGSPPMAAPRLR